MNALTGAWCKFTGWNANCFEVFEDDFYFGGNVGAVYKAWEGGADLNQPITADMQCAYNYFDDPGRLKRMTMVQPLMVTSGPITPTIAVDADFAVSSAVAPISILAFGAEWDIALWDVDTWPAGAGVRNPWLSAEAYGHALAIHMTVSVSSGILGGDSGEFDLGEFDSAMFDTGSSSSQSNTLQINAFNAIIELGGFV
jgi:hypothetical protein